MTCIGSIIIFFFAAWWCVRLAVSFGCAVFERPPGWLEKFVVSRGYKLPRLSTLTTVEIQQKELEVLREATVAAMLVYDEERQRIETMNSSLSPRRRPSRQNFTFFSYHNSPLVNASLLHYRPGSIAEQTIVSHQPGGNPKPLITKADRIQYPKNPENGYISRHSTIFRGCLCCRKEGHLFITCS